MKDLVAELGLIDRITFWSKSRSTSMDTDGKPSAAPSNSSPSASQAGSASASGEGSFVGGFRTAATKRVEELEARLTQLEASQQKATVTQEKTNSSVMAIQAKVEGLESSTSAIADNMALLTNGVNEFKQGLLGMQTLLAGVAKAQIQSGTMTAEEIGALTTGLTPGLPEAKTDAAKAIKDGSAVGGPSNELFDDADYNGPAIPVTIVAPSLTIAERIRALKRKVLPRLHKADEGPDKRHASNTNGCSESTSSGATGDPSGSSGMTEGVGTNESNDEIDLTDNGVFIDSKLTEVEAMLLNLNPNDTLF
jgi:hypothetical protein